MYRFDTTDTCARTLDRDDPLKAFRKRFYIPRNTIYMDGNSLGLQSRDAEKTLKRTLGEWKQLGIRGWLEGEIPWFFLAEKLGSMAAELVGAEASEVVATGTTTINIHALVSTFYNPKGKRKKILSDALNFPSDIYALSSHLKLRGCDPREDLIRVSSSDGKTYSEEAIVQRMTDEVALIFLPSVLYRSGQLLDMPYLTDEAQKRGICIGFDCSHSVGAVPHQLDAWGVDFALWCGYKYLNGGPGCTAFLYINKNHFHRDPRLAGWFGYVKEKQFDMLPDFEHQKSAGGWQISSLGILGSAPLEGALHLILEAGMTRIREKSKALTSYLIFLVDHLLSDSPYDFEIGTPRDPERRGGHVALERKEDGWRICEALRARGVVPDFRPPNIVRIAPVALYNTYHEVWQVVQYLKEIVDTEAYEKFSKARKAVS